MKRSELSETYCPIGRASAEILDGWTFVILRELSFRNCRFNGLQAQTRMSPRSLSQRLKALEQNGILDRSTDPEDGRSALYALTAKGEALWPVLVLLSDWGSRWCGPWDEDQPPITNRHGDHTLSPRLSCADCDAPVHPQEVRTGFSPRYRAERDSAEG